MYPNYYENALRCGASKVAIVLEKSYQKYMRSKGGTSRTNEGNESRDTSSLTVTPAGTFPAATMRSISTFSPYWIRCGK